MHDLENLQQQVAEVMARITAGDPRATWDLHALGEPTLRRMLQGEAGRVGAWLSDDDLWNLALDAAMDLAEMAGAWKPGGALPWVWARPRITALVHQHLGIFTRELDETRHDQAVPPAEIRVDRLRPVLRSLATTHEAARELDDRLTEVASERDAEIYLGGLLERSESNPSPAVTVAADHGMQPAAVRKVFQRVGERIASGDLAA